MSIKSLSRVAALFAVAAALTACGGGGGGDTSPAPAPTPAPVPSPPPPPPPAPVPPPTDGLVTAPHYLSLDDCGLLGAEIPAPVLTGDTMKFLSQVLVAVDPSNGYSVFARNPLDFTHWVNENPLVNGWSVGYGVHETVHGINEILGGCVNSQAKHYMLAGKVYATSLMRDQTANYSIADEALPANLKSGARYTTYILGSAKYANQFGILLDEFTAYTDGALTELGIASNGSYAYLATACDCNAGGLADFMSYFIAYLRAARLNHPETYQAIQSQPLTLGYMQTLWLKAEDVLAKSFPYSSSAKSGNPIIVGREPLAWAFDAAQLDELDRLGIKHGASTRWDSTYLKTP